MKTLIAVPVPAMDHIRTTGADGVTVETTLPGIDIFGRRSGACREGSRCGGV